MLDVGGHSNARFVVGAGFKPALWLFLFNKDIQDGQDAGCGMRLQTAILPLARKLNYIDTWRAQISVSALLKRVLICVIISIVRLSKPNDRKNK